MLDACRQWVQEVVLGLNLCPFAHPVWAADQVRFSASRAQTLEELVAELLHEAQVSPGTSLLVTDEFSFEQLLGVAELAEELLPDWQIVVFHPHFRFADSDPEDPANGVNRSPHGMLHLLLRSQVQSAAASHPDVAGIPLRNATLLRQRAEED